MYRQLSMEKCLHCVFNVFLCTLYAMISQLSMRSVFFLYSNFLLAHVRQWILSFQKKNYEKCSMRSVSILYSKVSLALVRQWILSFQ